MNNHLKQLQTERRLQLSSLGGHIIHKNWTNGMEKFAVLGTAISWGRFVFTDISFEHPNTLKTILKPFTSLMSYIYSVVKIFIAFRIVFEEDLCILFRF